MTTRTAPTSINAGSKDTSRALWHWLNETGNPGDTLKLQPDATYLTNYSIPLGSTNTVLKDRVLDLNGARLDRTAASTTGEEPWEMAGAWPRNNSFLHLRNCQDVAVFSSRPGARLRGPACQVSWSRKPTKTNPGIPLGVEYVAAFEAQHGFELNDVKGKRRNVSISLTQIEVSYLHGDGVYVGGDSEGIEILGDPTRGIGGGGTVSGERWQPTGWLPGVHHVGRQLLSVCRAKNWVVRDLALWQGRRSCFDLEPAGKAARVENGVIRNTKTGEYRLNWLASKGQGLVNHLDVLHNVSAASLIVTCGQPDTATRQDWHLDGNRSSAKYGSGTAADPNALMTFRNTTDVLVEHTYHRIDAKRFPDPPVEFIYGSEGIERDNEWVRA